VERLTERDPDPEGNGERQAQENLVPRPPLPGTAPVGELARAAGGFGAHGS
jgi:hypothetical protein